jgi:hypothetical protein
MSYHTAVTGKKGRNRRKDDFYSTPPECTVALLEAERHIIKKHNFGIWEPCAGDGSICQVLSANGYDFTATDLVDRGYPLFASRVDFLMERKTMARNIITNPPFNLADQFIKHALHVLQVDYVALLLKATYFHAEARRKMFLTTPPTRIYAMAWRPDFTGEKGSPMDCSWFIWQAMWPEGQSATEYRVLGRPNVL